MFTLGRYTPKKELIRANKDFPIKFSEKFRGLKLRFLAFTGGPGGFREVREAGRTISTYPGTC